MRYLFFLLPLLICCTRHAGQNIPDQSNAVVGDGCDGCAIMFQGMPKDLRPVDTSAGWHERGQKLIVEGTVTKLDGKTAADVIVYYWQTDNDGLYSKTPREQTDHGHLRGWIKTDGQGNFKIFTIRPVSYPKSTIPAHIHFSIKEPDLSNEYYIDDLLFDDDPFLTQAERGRLEKRGGDGIGKTILKNGTQYIRRDIRLGYNIPGYPK